MGRNLLQRHLIPLLLTAALLAGCSLLGLGRSNLPTATPGPQLLPPEWTSTPASAQPTALPSTGAVLSTDTPNASATLVPSGFANSAWLLEVAAPDGWTRAEALVELADGSVLAMGRVYQASWHSIWLARLTSRGQIVWLKQVAIPAEETFYAFVLAASPGGAGIVSGRHLVPAGAGPVEQEPVTLAISPAGAIEWILPYGARAVGVGAAGAVLLIGGDSLWQVDPAGQVRWRAGSQVGEVQADDFYPYADRMAGYRLATGDMLLAGTIEELVVPGGGADRAGPDPGVTSYWFARFQGEGTPAWKRVFTTDPLAQYGLMGSVTEGGHLVVGGTHRQLSQTDQGLSSKALFAWFQGLDPEGRTLYHRRLLDLPSLDGLEPTPDGGLLLLGKRAIERSEEYPAGGEQAIMVKLDPEGRIEWAREFKQGLEIHAVTALSEGGYLLSVGSGIQFARLDGEGQIHNCPQLESMEPRMRLEEQPARDDKAAAVPMALAELQPAGPEREVPSLSLSPAIFSSTELCRNLGP